MTKSILLIDDNEDFRETCRWILHDSGYDLWDAACPDEAWPMLSQEKFDLIICDLHMPFSNGPDAEQYITSYEVGTRTLRELTDIFPHIPIVALSATAPHDLRLLSKFLPVPAFPKPTNPDDLLDLLEVLTTMNGPHSIQ
jgi:CheY-like chemotaxis protein